MTTAGHETSEVGGAGLEALGRLRLEAFDDEDVALVRAARERLAETDLYVVALGEFKRGKSTLLNALVGHPVLPVGVVPLTAVVTVLRRGPAGAVARREDGAETFVDPKRLVDYVTEEGNPGNERQLSRVEVSLPDLDLPENAVLIDTPGLGSVFESGSDHTLRFLPHVDVALVVLSVDQPLSEAEARLAADLREQGTDVLFALNKTDHLSPEEVDQALAFVAGRLDRLSPEPTPVFGVSAKTALQGAAASGVPELRARLSEILKTRYREIYAAQSARRVRAVLDELEIRYTVRAEVAGRGEYELQVALEQLEKSRAEIARLAEEQDAIFAHRVKAIERGLGERMRGFQQRLEEALLAALKAIEGPGEEARERRVDEIMSEVIASLLSMAMPREVAVVRKELSDASERLHAALDGLAVSVAEDTEKILGVPIARPEPTAGTTLTPNVTVKLRDDPVVLEILTGALQAPLPGRVRRHLLVRRSRQRAAELANRHAGRLRSEIARGLREAGWQARHDAHEELDRISHSIETALERGIAQRRLAAAEADSARSEVATALESIRAARASLDAAG